MLAQQRLDAGARSPALRPERYARDLFTGTRAFRIPPSRINAEGKGNAQPLTKPGECAGAMSAGVIACLRPDRRVDVKYSFKNKILYSLFAFLWMISA